MPGSAYGRNLVGGSGSITLVQSANLGILVSGGSGPIVTLSLGELAYGTLFGEPFDSPSTPVSTGQILQFNGTVWTVGSASAQIPPIEVASTGSSPVELGTSSTHILSYAPATGQYRVTVSVEAAASASLDSVIVTYASETTGHATTAYLALQTPIAQYQAIAVGSLLINVATGTNVIVSGTALTASSLYASATIEKM